VGQNAHSYGGLDWIGSVIWWIGLDWILKNGPTDISGRANKNKSESSRFLSFLSFCTIIIIIIFVYYRLTHATEQKILPQQAEISGIIVA